MPEEDKTIETKTTFQELPDAPPRRKIRFTVTGKIGIFFVVFWVLMVFIGPYLSPWVAKKGDKFELPSKYYKNIKGFIFGKNKNRQFKSKSNNNKIKTNKRK